MKLGLHKLGPTGFNTQFQKSVYRYTDCWHHAPSVIVHNLKDIQQVRQRQGSFGLGVARPGRQHHVVHVRGYYGHERQHSAGHRFELFGFIVSFLALSGD